MLSLVFVLMFATSAHADLWQAAQEAGTRPDAQAAVVTTAQVPIEKIANPLAVDLAFNGFGLSWDLGTTRWAIDRGCREGNPIPLMAEVEGRIALKIGQAAFRGAVAYFLRRGGHKRAADVFRYAGGIVDFGLGVSNIRCGLKR